jgi:hypothetical protein
MDKPKKGRGGKREGAGRKELPPEIKKSRLEVYVETSVYDWIKVNGGNKFAAQLLTDAFRKGLIV